MSNQRTNKDTNPKDSGLDKSLDEMDKLVDELQAESGDIEELVEAAAQDAAENDEQDQTLDLTPLELAEAKAQEHHDNLLRLAAEMDNLRKRTTREVEQARKFAVERFAKEVLLIKDSLDMGMQASQAEGATVESIREGMEITMKQLSSGLEKFNIKEIEAAGAVFNPEFHEAMAMQPSTEHEPNTVMFVLQKGFMINERVLRPARVMVSKAPD